MASDELEQAAQREAKWARDFRRLENRWSKAMQERDTLRAALRAIVNSSDVFDQQLAISRAAALPELKERRESA
jgi:hypothetical protein